MNQIFIKNKIPLLDRKLFKNSGWGIISQVVQTVLMSLFFIILARKYSTSEFSKYIVATVLYQLMTAFSMMGLSQWFVREIAVTQDKIGLVNKFTKIQIYFGVFFYLLNILCAFAIYQDHLIYLLSLFVGGNIIFDNVINTIRYLNIADFEQRRNLILLTFETVLKFLVVSALFIYPFSTITLSIALLIVRFVTLNLFLKLGSSSIVSIKSLWVHKSTYKEVQQLVVQNWPFVVIGGVSILNWRVANILISKILTIDDVSTYEIGYKIFSIAQILPVIVSTTAYPMLIQIFNQGDVEKFKTFYRKMNLFYVVFGLLSFTFIYSFVDLLIPLAFGSKYSLAAYYAKTMFLTILVFPTAYLKANIIVAMKLERKDMFYNIVAFFINIVFCAVGLYFWRTIAAVNFAIFVSFLVFHILQDILLIRRGIASIKYSVSFYILTLMTIMAYILLARYVNSYLLYLIHLILTILLFVGLSNSKLKIGKRYFRVIYNEL